MAKAPALNIPSLRQRRWRIGLHVLVQVVALLLVVVMVNWFLARHHPKRWDLSRGHYYKLSPKTEQGLKSLRQPLDIVVYIPRESSRDFVQKALHDTRNLLKEFENVARKKLRVEYVDPDRDLNRARQLAEKYRIDSPDQIVFACGERSKLVKLDDTVEVEGGPLQTPRIRFFKGEGVFLSAILSVTEGKPPKVYFLTGHGERDPDNTDERSGYSVPVRLHKTRQHRGEKVELGANADLAV
ncbi:MAG: GldG family protein [Verrucomicrobiae bacterium]|nr:GldG family protein [Verrucomicrobiae bacterium]